MSTEFKFSQKDLSDKIRKIALDIVSHYYTPQPDLISSDKEEGLPVKISISMSNYETVGYLTIFCTKNLGNNIVRSMLCIPQDEPIDNETWTDALGEICNQIMGRIKMFFINDYSLTLNIGIPEVNQDLDNNQNASENLIKGNNIINVIKEGESFMNIEFFISNILDQDFN